MDTTPALPGGRSRRTMSWVFLATGCLLFVLAYFVGITDTSAGITALLVGFFAVILALFYRFGNPGGHSPALQLLYWAPRALCISYAAFISLFALDVVQDGQGFWETLLALLIHLIPTFAICAVLALSWRREWVAGTLFIAAAAFFAVRTLETPFGRLSTLLLIGGPLVLTGVLFLLNWHFKDALRGGSSPP